MFDRVFESWIERMSVDGIKIYYIYLWKFYRIYKKYNYKKKFLFWGYIVIVFFMVV